MERRGGLVGSVIGLGEALIGTTGGKLIALGGLLTKFIAA